MTIGTPIQLGTQQSLTNVSTTAIITTGADSAAGNLIVVFCGEGTTQAINSVTDSVSNTYTPGTDQVGGGIHTQPYWCVNAKALPSGGTITVTYAGLPGSKYACAVSVPGVGAATIDINGAGATATSTTPSIATGTLGQAEEIVFGFVFIVTGGSDTLTSEATGFTANTAVLSAGNSALRSAYKIVSSTGTVTYNPVLGTSRTWDCNVLTFKADLLAGQALL